ncbi:MAG TPA: hypothetical protein VHG08_19730 [Longimicrobium sp.]|nr:hypothetical protein [Longimicrobium sp.]
MTTRQLILLLAAAAASIAPFPQQAEAQCKWGCRCMDNACGCNSNGSGSSCDNGGNGCVVTGCDSQVTQVEFAPDGSIVRFASTTPAPSAGDAVQSVTADSPEAMAVALGGSYRWEYLADGRSVARHCSGLILARYYDPAAAAALREQTRTLSL